jgi:hypothetical protein
MALRVHGAAEQAMHRFRHARPVIIQVHDSDFTHTCSLRGGRSSPLPLEGSKNRAARRGSSANQFTAPALGDAAGATGTDAGPAAAPGSIGTPRPWCRRTSCAKAAVSLPCAERNQSSAGSGSDCTAGTDRRVTKGQYAPRGNAGCSQAQVRRGAGTPAGQPQRQSGVAPAPAPRQGPRPAAGSASAAAAGAPA